MRIYNLFPLLAGKPVKWQNHARRAKNTGFNWIYINPFFEASERGSLYSVRNYEKIHHKLAMDEEASIEPVLDFVRFCHGIGLKVMMSLDFSCLAVDSPLFEEHPEWQIKDKTGEPKHPVFNKDDKKLELLTDMVEINERNARNRKDILEFRKNLIIEFSEYGFDGFKIDSVKKLNFNNLQKLINSVRKEGINPLFVADSLGCTVEEILEIIKCDFDYIFNSSKYWDFKSKWCFEQHNLTRTKIKTISFPETHDNERLINEVNNDIRMVKLRFTFSALFSSGFLIPMGFEYGFRKRLDTINMDEKDWEPVNVDLTSFISRVNGIKEKYPVFEEESEIISVPVNKESVVVFFKISKNRKEKVLFIINTDPWSYQNIVIEDLREIFKIQDTIIDISPEYAMDGVGNVFKYYLRPAQIKILYGKIV